MNNRPLTHSALANAPDSDKQTDQIILAVAPMEGVMDHTMRALLSRIGGMDYLVSEFIRVTERPISEKAFHTRVPELLSGASTIHGHPVHVQLLGSNPEMMAASAINAVTSGATHIDVNFGCPAKRVNGNGGGSYLLQYPEKLYDITHAIRVALPDNIPLSTKMRLGYEDESLFKENVAAVEQAGAGTLTIHGRTKVDGYKPPARWEKIALAKEISSMTIIANGDIDSYTSLMACQRQTGCCHFMVGRGSLRNPFIFQELRGNHSSSEDKILILLCAYMDELLVHYDEFATLGRIKQWSAQLKLNWPSIANNLKAIRSCESIEQMKATLSLLAR